MTCAVQLYIPQGLVENEQHRPLLWFPNKDAGTLESQGFYSGFFIISKIITEYADMTTIRYRLYHQIDETDLYEEIGFFLHIESAMQVAELLENG